MTRKGHKMQAHPAYCCQTCGAEIGYLGRAIQWLGLPIHRCNMTVDQWAEKASREMGGALSPDEIRSVWRRHPDFAPGETYGPTNG